MKCFCYITGTTIIYSVHKHDVKSPWFWDVNHGNNYISILQIEQRKSTLKPRSTVYNEGKPEVRNRNVNADYFYSSVEKFKSVASYTEFVYNKLAHRCKYYMYLIFVLPA